MDSTKSHEPDWNCLIASGVIEGPTNLSKHERQPITKQRVCDYLSGFALGSFLTFVLTLVFISQINQFPN